MSNDGVRFRPAAAVIDMTLAKVDGDGRLASSQCTTTEVGKKENDKHESRIFEKDLTTVERILVIISVVLAAAIVVVYTSIQPSKCDIFGAMSDVG